MLNFSVGPVTEPGYVLAQGSLPTPYFRTAEFSERTLESERLLLGMLGSPPGSRAVFLTGSGTAAMEAAVAGLLGEGDRALVVTGGAFGDRFAEICDVHGIVRDVARVALGSPLSGSDLEPFAGAGHTAVLVQAHETSTGTLLGAEAASGFCRREGCMLVVDAISSFLADPFDMAALGADAVIVGS